MFLWSDEIEARASKMRENGSTYSEIAVALGTTPNSVKHKIRRLQQNNNEDRYKHTAEKTEQARKFLSGMDNKILETHSGFGGMTKLYQEHGCVESYDIDGKRVDFVNDLKMSNVTVSKKDTEQEIIRLLADKRIYDIIDIDPYGFPSRYFPHVFGLIDNGLLFLTFPVMGVAQINKIMVVHYKAFWGITLADKDNYVDKIIERLEEYAFMHKREIEVLDILRLDRIYRFVIKVEKKSTLDIVGLVVNR